MPTARYDPGMAIRPFRLVIPDDDLRDRLSRTRWPAPLPGEPWARGVPVDSLRGLADYWRDGFDWRAAEARFNTLPQLVHPDARIVRQPLLRGLPGQPGRRRERGSRWGG